MLRRGFFTILLLVAAGAAVFFYQEHLDNNTVVRMRPPAGFPLPEAMGAKSPSVFAKLDAIDAVSARQEIEPAPVATTSAPTKAGEIVRTPIGVTNVGSPKATPKKVAKTTSKTRGGRIASKAKKHSRIARK